MRKAALLTAFVLVVAACGGSSEADTTTSPVVPTTTAAVTPTTETPPPDTTSPAVPDPTTTESSTSSDVRFVITSVSLGTLSKVVIENIGGEVGSLGGHWLCQAPSYYELPDVELAPGQAAAISTGGDIFVPPPDAIAIDEIASIGILRSTGGEVALYFGADFSSSDDILSYVEWGSPRHTRSVPAVAAGIWPDGGFVPTTEDTGAILATQIPATDPTHWTSG
jgi:hypothetical protein